MRAVDYNEPRRGSRALDRVEGSSGTPKVVWWLHVTCSGYWRGRLQRLITGHTTLRTLPVHLGEGFSASERYYNCHSLTVEAPREARALQS